MTADQTQSPLAVRALAVTAAAVLLALPAAVLIYRWHMETLNIEVHVKEGGAVELLHGVLTALAAVLFARAWVNGKGAVRVAGAALTMLAAAAFVREADVEVLSKAVGWHWLVWLGERGLQEILLVAMTLPIFAYFYRQRRYFWDVVKLALRWQAWPLHVAGALIVLSVYMDERIVHGMQMRFWEELIETYGYVFMGLAGWRHFQLVGDPQWDHDAPAP